MQEHPSRSIPASGEAEKAVLGSIMIDPDAMGKVAGNLTPQDFFSSKNAILYETFYALHKRQEPIDFVTIIEELERHSKLDECGGPAYITDLIATTPTALYVEHYAKIVEENAKRRRYLALATKIAELAYDESKDLTDVTNEVQALTLSATMTKGVKGLRQIKAATQKTMAAIQKAMVNKGAILGVPSGFAVLDRLLGGFQGPDLTILAARPGMGKSAMAFTIAKHAAKKDNVVAVFSMEMSEDQFIRRLLSMEAMIDGHKLRNGSLDHQEIDNLVTKANELGNLPLFLDDSPALSVAYVAAECRKIKSNEGRLDLVIVDYMQLMASMMGKRENRHLELSQISKGLKALAKELNVPIISLSQLSREVEKRSDKRPMLSDLRESGAIEEDADIVLFIYRDDYYHEESSTPNIAEIIIAKHRQGATGNLSLYFRKELTQFRELDMTRGEKDDQSDQSSFDFPH